MIPNDGMAPTLASSTPVIGPGQGSVAAGLGEKIGTPAAAPIGSSHAAEAAAAVEPGHAEETEERAWMDAFLAGDEEGFNRLVLKHQDRVYRLCHRFFGGDSDEAADAAQETFVKVYHALSGFRGDARFSTWLYRIALNVCKNRVASAEYRHERQGVRLDRRADPERAERQSGEGFVAGKSLQGSLQTEPMEEYERSRSIEQAIAALPEEQRALVILRDVEGHSYEEVAGATGLNLGTVKSRLNRARGVLRERLRALGIG